jgi:hypothetical protein
MLNRHKGIEPFIEILEAIQRKELGDHSTNFFDNMYTFLKSEGYTKTKDEFITNFYSVNPFALMKHIHVEEEMRFMKMIDEYTMQISIDVIFYTSIIDLL